MSKSTNKTQPTFVNPEDFIKSINHPQRIADGLALLKMMEEITGQPPKMWGPSIIGFGTYHYKYASGREGDFLAVGFSPRKSALSIYIMSGFSEYDELMQKLGKFTTGKSCLYVKQLSDIQLDVLKELILKSYLYITNKKWP